MIELLPLMPWLIAMVVLMACSGFFSASEAALFYLRPRDRNAMQSGSVAEKAAAQLLEDPDRLLSSILFWNLVINIIYFAISSSCSLRIERIESWGQSGAVLFALASLLAIIFFSEMMPKSLAVLKPKTLATALSLPLSVAVRTTDPIMPLLQWICLVSRRLIWPGFKPEPYLEIQDVQQAIQHSGNDPELIEQEQAVLQNIVDLGNIRIDEWMRPRTQFVMYRPPVSLADLKKLPPSGYLLISETDSAEIERAIRLDNQFELPETNIERFGEPVLYQPWCATVADAFEKMSHRSKEVTVVVNEFGDTIGILTIEDILEAVFSYSPSRSRRLLDTNPITEVRENEWDVSGMTSIRRLAKHLQIELPETDCVTLGGVVQDEMQRLVKEGDHVRWGPLQLEVTDAPQRSNMLLRVTLDANKEDGP
jgi:CBS domain containing-hemolysin-like protein